VLPPLSLGTVMGAPFALSLGALLAGWAAGAAGFPRAAGALGGLAVALDHRALLAVPLVAIAGLSRERVIPTAVSGAAAYAAIVGPVALLDATSFFARVGEAAVPGPGLGVVNLLAYRGAEDLVRGLAPVAWLLAIAVVGCLLTRLRLGWSPLACAGIASLVGIVLAPAISAEAVGMPIVLLGLAVASRTDDGLTD
jgi:hypothetical protein